MKQLTILLISLFLYSCNQESDDAIDVSQIPFPEASFKITVKKNFETFETLYTAEYSFDTDGKVLATKFISDNPQNSYFSTFQYDDNGRIISETRNNRIVARVTWNGNTATVYRNGFIHPSNYVFSNGNLSEFYGTGYVHHKINYDENNNIISEENDNQVYVEYLNYNTSVSNPYHVLKSIAILGNNFHIFSKNIFETKMAYPYQDYDFFVDLTYYQFHYTLDQNNRVTTMTSDETTIYKTFFEYY